MLLLFEAVDRSQQVAQAEHEDFRLLSKEGHGAMMMINDGHYVKAVAELRGNHEARATPTPSMIRGVMGSSPRSSTSTTFPHGLDSFRRGILVKNKGKNKTGESYSDDSTRSLETHSYASSKTSTMTCGCNVS